MNGQPAAVDRVQAALASLKDFQRETVDAVFDQLYAPDGSGRFLVADEVGLGKTMVARGVVAKSIQHLRGKVDRIDVVYICSSTEIARQNVNRLSFDESPIGIASRLTLLPKIARKLSENRSKVNFISFTPGTTFDVATGLGHREERVLLYSLLREPWQLGTRAAPLNVLSGNVDADRFRGEALSFDLEESANPVTVRAFQNLLARRMTEASARGEEDLRTRFEALCTAYPTSRSDPGHEVAQLRSRLVGELRSILAQSCVETLEPDLVILDEFQRFSHILDGDDEASRLARAIFDYPGVRVLLLSATPYKMYTAAGEAGGEDHYRDFVRTVSFLEGKDANRQDLEDQLDAYRQALLGVDHPGGLEQLESVRTKLQQRLRRVMVRTERLASTPDRNGMLVERASATPAPSAEDVLAYASLDALTHRLEQPDPMEYWKSAPFALNFMDDQYELKRALETALEDGAERMSLAPLMRQAETLLLDWKRVEEYRDVQPTNPRLRELIDSTVGQGAHELLWIPPALPYYTLGEPFSSGARQNLTKRLIFSAWRFVPRAIAALVTYEAERRMVEHGRVRDSSSESRAKRPRLLRFGRAEGGRLTGMPVLAMMYPSIALAQSCNPLVLATELAKDQPENAGAASLSEVLQLARERIEIALGRLPKGEATSAEDERWYWAAPLLLDAKLEPEPTRRWLNARNLAERWSGAKVEDETEVSADKSDVWRAHLEQARELVHGKGEPLGRRPADLVDVLAELALGGPGTTMLRAVLRVAGLDTRDLRQESGDAIRDGAARAAWNFRGLFNQPEVTEMARARGSRELPYWRQVLQYAMQGCLQAALDEYVHILRDHRGLSAASTRQLVEEIADEIAEALSLQAASLSLDAIAVSESGRTIETERQKMRCHFALRFGDERSDDGSKTLTRADAVRKAFNSPFWPFVLATTSVGQEGLDFHTYCHALVHWNLPSNPVDLEQREGRVHRYKNHAVRKNVAQTFGAKALREGAFDPWQAMFDEARASRPEGSTDIIPYWVYSTEGGARIERHIAAMPLSRERERMIALSKSLAVYRMVFGQPRQDDLVRHFVNRNSDPSLAQVMEAARIDLAAR